MRFLSLSRCGLLCVTLLCSAAVPAWAAPGQASLVSPTGEVTGSTIVFTWNAVSDSTWYLFWVGSSTGRPLQQWYTAAQAGCAGGVGACSVSLTLGFNPGPLVSWYVQTWNATGFGPWSGAADFSIKDTTPTWGRKLPSDPRWATVFDGGAILDNETGLTWEQAPFGGTGTWLQAVTGCMQTTTGSRQGWRLPSVSELTTLADPTASPGLPPGNPFSLGTVGTFWTQTNSYDTQNILVVDYSGTGARILPGLKTDSNRAWCVRGTGSDRLQ